MEEIRAKQAAHKREMRAADPEAVRAQQRAHYAANKAVIRAQAKARYAANPERERQYSANYRAANRERTNAVVRAWRAAHPDKAKAVGKAWAAAHPEAVHAARRRRAARVRGAPVADFTAEQWIALQHAFDHRCAYCDRRRKGRLTQDHITPLSQGGAHTASNIVPACASCNSKKHTGPPLRPVQPVLL